MKTCYKCKEEKLNDEFSATEFRKNSSKCKACVELYNREYRTVHAEEKKENDKKYREENREYINVQRRIENLSQQQKEQGKITRSDYTNRNKRRINKVRGKRKKDRFKI